MGQAELEGMPEPAMLRVHTSDGLVLVTVGRALMYRYEAGDTGMRNLAIVALTDAGRRVDEVAAGFGLTATYVSILRGRARRQGSAGLAARRGRPPKLTGRQARQARAWAAAGWTQHAIADRYGVAQSVISELLARLGPAPVQQELPEPTEEPVEQAAEEPVEQAAEEPVEQAAEEPVQVAGPEPVLASPTGAGSVFRWFGPDRYRDVPVPVCRGDAGARLPAPGRRRGDLRVRDRWPGPPL